jgi:ADP-ribosyl-[dinitrogen reductase] hydrolase
MKKQSRIRGCLIGLACGDAVGTAVEFSCRGTFPPVTDMVGGGVFGLKAGEWTDDTSMALCIAESLIKNEGRFSARDIMDNFVKWRDEGQLSSTGKCFDIGGTVQRALNEYKRTGNPFSGSTDQKSAGNGCLMRLAPIPMAYHNHMGDAIGAAELSSMLTHGPEECVQASGLFAAMLWGAINGASKEAILSCQYGAGKASPRMKSILAGEYKDKSSSEIKGDGYVMNSFEAALWCFYSTRDFRSAILMAANLGDDADTTAAITGQLAGAYYGLESIPSSWRYKLAMGGVILIMSDQLMRIGM